MAIFGDPYGQGDSQSTTDHLQGTAELPLSGVGFRAAHQPRHRDDVPDRAGHTTQRVPPRPLSGDHILDPWESGNQSISQAVWHCSPRTYSDQLSQMEVLLYHCRTPCCSALRDSLFSVRGSCPLDGRGQG